MHYSESNNRFLSTFRRWLTVPSDFQSGWDSGNKISAAEAAPILFVECGKQEYR